MAISSVTIGKLEYLTAENLSVPHCFTTRYGGVSRGSLSSLNIGTHRNDDPACVRQNFEILASALGFSTQKLVLSHQTHTDIVRPVGKAEHGAGLYTGELEPCDALITNEPGTALVVFSADCTPILLHDPITGAVGAVHAGWRGTAAGIGAKAVEAMCCNYGAKRENIRAAIGPNIGPCCFETDYDVPKAMLEQVGKEAEAWIYQKGEKYYVNLKEMNALWLYRAGVQHVEISPVCTACQPERFWSHRRHGDGRGAQGAIILCKEAGL